MTIHYATSKPRFTEIQNSLEQRGPVIAVILLLIQITAFLYAGTLNMLLEIIQPGISWIVDSLLIASLEFLSILTSSHWMF